MFVFLEFERHREVHVRIRTIGEERESVRLEELVHVEPLEGLDGARVQQKLVVPSGKLTVSGFEVFGFKLPPTACLV